MIGLLGLGAAIAAAPAHADELGADARIGSMHASASAAVVDEHSFEITSPSDHSEVAPGDVFFFGTAAPGDLVTFTDAAGTVIAVATTDADGAWAVRVPISKGAQIVTVSAAGQHIDFSIVGVDDTETLPVIDAGIAGSALTVAAVAGIGLTVLRRRSVPTP